MKNWISAAIGVSILLVILFAAVIPQVQSAKNLTYQARASDVIQAPWTYDVPIALSHSNIVPGSEKVYNATYTAVEGTDYTIDYTNGTITFLSTGNLVNTSNYNVDYLWNAPAYTGTDLTILGLCVLMLCVGAIVMVWRTFMRW